jgi:hypothetical protein
MLLNNRKRANPKLKWYNNK